MAPPTRTSNGSAKTAPSPRNGQRLNGHVLAAGMALRTDDVDDGVDVRRGHAGQDRRVATPKEAANAADLGGRVAPLDQPLDQPVRVDVRRDDDYQPELVFGQGLAFLV